MRFSIITITRNNAAGLQKTKASIEAQSCKDFEWIIIDGASTDNTKDILKSCDAKITSEPDQGIYDAMNKGLTKAGGKYVLFLNAGDSLASPKTLEKLLPVTGLNPTFIYGDALEERPNSEPAYKSAKSHRSIARGMFTHHQAMLYKRSEIGALQYDLKYKIAADYDFTARFLTPRMDKALYFRSPLCIFESGGISQQNTKKGRQEQFQIRKDLNLAPLPVNHAISALQCAASHLRALAPNLYWKLKK